MIDPDDYDCTKCGACCVSDFDAPDYVHLLPKELDRLSQAERNRYIYTDRTYGKPQTSMKTAYDKAGNCRCKALEGDLSKEVKCAIYEDRPDVCRNFQPETDVCDYARQLAFGLSHK